MIMTDKDSGSIEIETLVAYADGTLDADETARVGEMLATDRGSERLVAALRRTGAMAATAYDDVLEAPVPPHLVAAASGNVAGTVKTNPVDMSGGRATNDNRRRWALTAAAAMLALIVGFGVGRWTIDSGRAPDLMPAGTNAQDAIEDPALLGALSSLLADDPASGRSRSFADGTISLLAPFERADGSVCWQFRRAGDAVAAVDGIACPAGGGSYVVHTLSDRDKRR